MIALHNRSSDSCQVLGKITTPMRPDFKDRLMPAGVNEFPPPANRSRMKPTC